MDKLLAAPQAAATPLDDVITQQLTQSEVRYRRLFEAARDGILILDAVTRKITDVNPFMVELLGYAPADFLGRELWEIGLLRDAEASAAAFAELQETGYIRYDGLPLQARNGEAHDVEFVSNVYEENGRQVVQCNIRDITERKRIEWTSARLAAIVESSEDGITSGTLNGVVTTWNAGAQTLFGYSALEAIGQPVSFLAPQDRPGELLPLLDQVRRGEQVKHYETVRLCKDGTLLDVSLSMSPLKDADGVVVGASLIQRDITERKRTESSLIESRTLLQATLDALSSHIAVLDENGTVIAINKAWRQFYENNGGSAFSCGTGANYFEVCDAAAGEHAEESASVAQGLRDVMAGNSDLFCLEYPCHGAQQKRWFNIRVTRFVGEGPARMVVAHENITARRLVEAEQAELQAQMEGQRQRLNTIVATVPGLVWETWGEPDSAAQHNNFVSDYVQTMLGYTVQEWLATPNFWLSLVHSDDRERTEREAAGIFTGRKGGTLNYRWKTKDGRYIWVESRLVVVYDETGRPLGARGVSMDITERKQAEEALQQAHNELEMRVAKRTSELAQSNRDLQVKIREREEAVAETRSRASQQEAVAELGRQALTDIDIDALMSTATQLVKITLNVELSTVLELLPDGETLRIRNNVGWTGPLPDRTLYGKAKSQAGYALMSNTPIIVSDLQQDTRFTPSQFMIEQGIVSGITVVVGGEESQFGTLGAHSTKRRVFNQDDVHFLQSMSNVLAAALAQRRSNEKLRLENVERQIALVALENVTAGFKEAKEEAEQARESADAANLAKSEFLSRMSHELRTPLNAILGFGQLLSKQDFAPEQQGRVQHILKAGRHLLDLINEVLEIARIEAGHMLLSLEPVQVCETVEEVFALLRPLAAEFGIALQGCDDPNMIVHVQADRQKLKQVMLNLCSNAIKYNRPQGSIYVTCENVSDLPTSGTQAPCDMLRINVTDTGMGIAAVDQAQLFVPFMRVGAEKTTIEGTGLGLALSRSLMLAMAGTIGVESTLGVGSTFWLQLPLATSPMMVVRPDHELSTKAPKVDELVTHFKILYIEDNLSNLQLIEAILRDQPAYELITAMQGQMGLDLARQNRPDLILLDLHLPDLPGDRVLERLKADPSTAAIPVVMLSAVAMESEVKRLLAGGADAYLTKPLNIDLFLGTIADILRPKRRSA